MCATAGLPGRALGSRKRFPGFANFKLNANLVNCFGREALELFDAGLAAQLVECPLNPLGRGRGEREPEVPGVTPLVVVRDARKTADPLGDLGQALGGNPCRHERRGVSEPSRIEDRADAANDARSRQASQAIQEFIGADSQPRRERIERPFLRREARLDCGQDFLVEVVHVKKCRA